MSAAVVALGESRARPTRVAFSSLRGLTAIEARCYATRLSLWVGWALTVLLVVRTLPSDGEWPGATYESLVPLSFGPMLLGVFVAAVRTGGRDRSAPAGLAPEAPIDDLDRAAGRLLALVVPVGLAVLTTIGIAIASRIEGGFWLGEGARRTDSARHGVVELLQPTLLVALLGAIGVAIGRSRRYVLWIVVTVFVLVATFTAWWMFSGPVLSVVDPIQMMPLRVDLPSGVGPAETPVHWFVDYDAYSSDFQRQMVHRPTVIGHDLYLLGLVGVAGAAVARDRRTIVRAASAVVVVAGLAVQFSVSPW